ncbi:putative U3 small nucleolar RNA-associated protein [Paramyrothecium foliicola]|nr:putative U3 small nucleolar RNA-associated protein [Paramyrothecium foliicola]
MSSKQPLKTTFDVGQVLRPIFTGGSVAIDNRARILATTLGEDVVLSDPATGNQLGLISGDGEVISTLTLTPSGSHLIVCSRSLSMRIYALKSLPDEQSIEYSLTRSVKPHTTPVVVVAVDRTSTLLATGGTDGAIKVWDIAGGHITHTFRGPSVLVSALHFFEVAARSKEVSKARKGKETSDESVDADEASSTTQFRLVSGSQDGKVRVWDLHKRNCIAKLDSHVSDVKALDYSPTQDAIVTASRDKTIIWWDVKSWKIRKVVPCLELIEAAGFVDDGNLTYSAGSNGCLRIWETDSGRELTPKQPAKSEEEGVVSAIYRPGLPFILTVQVDHTLALFKLPSKDTSASLSVPVAFRRISGTHDEIIDLSYVLADRSLLALATNSEDIRLVSVAARSGSTTEPQWDSDDAPYFGQDVAQLRGHEEIVVTLDVDWSGHWIATGAKDNTAKLWRLDPKNNSYECWATFSGHAESVGAVALPKSVPPESSASRSDPVNNPPAFLVTGSQDQTIKKWEIPRKPQPANQKPGARALFTRKAHEKDINAIDVHHSGHLFASASQDKTVKIWSVEEGEVQGILRGHKRGVWSVRFSPANLPAIQGEDGPVTGKGVILTGSGDKTIKLWSLSDYTCVRTFEGHSNSVLKVAWLTMPGGSTSSKRPVHFASAGGDGLVKVWDANTGEADCTLDNHEDRVWALAVHPETNTIVSGSGDSTVTLWKDTTTETQAAASQAALQLIEQEQELQNHIHAGSYREAITLALQLNHPGRLLHLFTSVVTTANPEQGSLSGLKAVDEVLANLSDEQIFLLLLRLRDWNTNARTAPVAQKILWTVVRSYPASKLSNLSVKGAQGLKSLRDIMHGLRVYTERHYKRIEELVDESYLVEYTLQEIDSIAPATEEDDVLMREAENITVFEDRTHRSAIVLITSLSGRKREMAKRHASEALEELLGVDSPASKRSRVGDLDSPLENGAADASTEDRENGEAGSRETKEESDDEDFEDELQPRPAIRQLAPTDGYDDLYLDTIDRNVLDFDFEKLCSVSLSNINVYACLVCGKYFQGRGPKSHAYFHALDEDHHVYINLETQKVYVLPEGYEVKSKALDDVKYVSDPRYTKQEVVDLDRVKRTSWTLGGKEYTPGFVGMNNIKENDYLNVIVQALAHVSPLRNFLLMEDFSKNAELVKRCSILVRKIWNPRAFKAHVSPHELLQEISLRSNKRFTLTTQSDPVDFLSWFLNNLHLGLGGSKTKPGSSMIQKIFQGKLKVESQAITARADVGDRLRFEEAAEVKVDIVRFLFLTLDLPSAPLFQDELEKNIIPQVPLTTILSKYDGKQAQEHHAQRKRYRLLHPLPPFLVLHVKRFSQNKFVSERNPTIVTFDARNLDVSPYVEPNPKEWPPGEPIWYDLVANVVHEAVRLKDDVADSGEERKTWKAQVKNKATGEWVVCQDLYVDKVQSELLYLGETYLQIWERRRDPKIKGKTKA